MRIPRRYYLVLGTFSLSVLLYVDRVCISAAKESIGLHLRLGEREMGWVLSSFALGYALCQTPSGYLADWLGARRVLTAVVVFWSIFTGLTAAAFNLVSLLIIRFLFGAGEAGAFPGIARASYSWIPMQERGVVQGINFSGARLGAAFALPLLAAMIVKIGWQGSFLILMLVGFAWAGFWYVWFRDDPAEHPHMDAAELNYILANRQRSPGGEPVPLKVNDITRSANMWLLCLQYFASNFTFFFCLTWLFPYMKKTYQLEFVEAGWYSSAPLIGGAVGNWVSGWMVDFLYRRGWWVWSRRLPAVVGFVLAATGILGFVGADGAGEATAWFTLAVFGADMTLAPSWSCCIDIGKRQAGVVSGTMNMAGNLGSFLTGIAFPYLEAWTGDSTPFFYVGAALNLTAVAVWLWIDPRKGLVKEQ
jgi:ACS family glucarate transporter-like MFS transporter